MKKNSQIHLWIETEILLKLKKRAEDKGITLAEYCRLKLRENSKLNRIEFLLEEIKKAVLKKT